MGPLTLALCLLAAPAVPASEALEKPRLFVSSISAVGVEPTEASFFTDAIAGALSSRGLFQVITTKDLESLLGAERQKQLLGICETDPAQCSRGAANAVTARFLLSGQLSRLGSAYQLTLQMVDTEKGEPVARALRLSDNLGTLRALVPYIAAEATGSPLPPPPSKAIPITLISVGAATLLSGAVLGMLALSRQTVVNEELCPTGAAPLMRCEGVSLRSREFYLAQNDAIGTQKSISLALLIGGAALAVVGVLLWPQGDTGARVALVPSSSGLAVVGAW